MSDEPSSLEHVLDRRLAAVRTTRPDLEPALALQDVLIRTALSSARPPRTTEFRLPRERALMAIQTGVPLLHEQNLEIDLDFAADLFSRLVNALLEGADPELEGVDSELGGAAPEHQGAVPELEGAELDLGPRLRELVAAATSGRLDAQRLFAEAFVQHADHVLELAVHAGVDPSLLALLSHHAIAPVLRAYAHRALRIVDNLDDGTQTAAQNGAAWRRGYCPVCGAWPLLGELRGADSAAYLRCSGCGAAWRWQPEQRCPYCARDDAHGDADRDGRDHDAHGDGDGDGDRVAGGRTLHVLQLGGERRFRLSVCDRCKGYLKVGNAFDPLPAALLPLDDLVSMHLDALALERGYRRPGGSGFPIELAVPDAEWLEELA